MFFFFLRHDGGLGLEGRFSGRDAWYRMMRKIVMMRDNPTSFHKAPFH